MIWDSYQSYGFFINFTKRSNVHPCSNYMGTFCVLEIFQKIHLFIKCIGRFWIILRNINLFWVTFEMFHQAINIGLGHRWRTGGSGGMALATASTERLHLQCKWNLFDLMQDVILPRSNDSCWLNPNVFPILIWSPYHFKLWKKLISSVDWFKVRGPWQWPTISRAQEWHRWASPASKCNITLDLWPGMPYYEYEIQEIRNL